MGLTICKIQEKEDGKSNITAQTEKLHWLAVNWHTMLKDIADIQHHIQHLYILAEFSVKKDPQLQAVHPSGSSARQALELQKSSCEFWSRWVTTYLERTNIRINLVSNASDSLFIPTIYCQEIILNSI